MRNISLELKIITPMFLGGANLRGEPELRAPPFRGQLRYWLRTICGDGMQSGLTHLREAESEAFGDTEVGSSLTLRPMMISNHPLRYGIREFLLHREESKSKREGRQKEIAFVEDQCIQLHLISRPLTHEIPEIVLKALLLWVALGGIGKRTRRGFGSLQINKPVQTDFVIPTRAKEILDNPKIKDGEELSERIFKILTYTLGCSMTKSSVIPIIPNYPCDYPAFVQGSWLVGVCQEAFDNQWDALRDFMKYHLRIEEFMENDRNAFGYVNREERRASPFHLHVAQSQQGFHWVLTALNAKPPPSPTSWNSIQKLFNSCCKDHQGMVFY